MLLGFTVMEPRSGYGLKRWFSTTPASVYQPSPGALYPALRRLVRRGLLSAEEQISAGRRRLRLYRATEAGRAAHLEWLRQPVNAASIGNDLALHLMRFVMMEKSLEHDEVLAFMQAFADANDSFITRMEGYLASAAPMARHGRLAVLHGIALHRASLEWSRSTMAELAALSRTQGQNG